MSIFISLKYSRLASTNVPKFFLYFLQCILAEVETEPEQVDDYKMQVSTVLATLNSQMVMNLMQEIDNGEYIRENVSINENVNFHFS